MDKPIGHNDDGSIRGGGLLGPKATYWHTLRLPYATLLGKTSNVLEHAVTHKSPNHSTPIFCASEAENHTSWTLFNTGLRPEICSAVTKREVNQTSPDPNPETQTQAQQTGSYPIDKTPAQEPKATNSKSKKSARSTTIKVVSWRRKDTGKPRPY
ncbi:uncharacterized protein CLUP02_00035 [Colletotrichum lupini]|uniref:Uncharacterized protein n=1 Tax=Colletotrichum lupini TaxID=145971 RepID=A0A9Q8SAI7_9PEZI|nr:uncharacterized protein CLUP02_00035 [Colletotrichum lupini]UQC73391.1 hypothetical protein CLUP02_00035 [Colletotrichum lupini]